MSASITTTEELRQCLRVMIYGLGKKTSKATERIGRLKRNVISFPGAIPHIRHSHDRWHRDFNNFRNEYISKFASAIYDYTVSVVAGELRHSDKKASQYIKEYYYSWQNRSEVYDECFVYNASDILAAGIRMFDTGLVKWREGYGGEKWKLIAKAGQMKGKVTDCVFIDHCVDLSHNNSIYFDKRARIFILHNQDEYRDLLNMKQNCEPEALLGEKLGSLFNKLLQRAYNLCIINEKPAVKSFSTERDQAETLLFSYHPIKWGSKRLDYSESNIITRQNLDNRMRRICEDDREYAQAA